MSFINLFYPDNPARRERCIRLSGKIFDAMEMNFISTNKLIALVGEKLKTSIEPLHFNEDISINQNAKNLEKKAEEIRRVLDDKLVTYKDAVGKELYEKLVSKDTSTAEKFKLIKKVAPVMQVQLASIVLVRNVHNTWEAVPRSFAAFKEIWFGSVILEVLVGGADVLFSAIAGAIERKQYNKTADELKRISNKIVPAAHEFNQSVFMAEYMLNHHLVK